MTKITNLDEHRTAKADKAWIREHPKFRELIRQCELATARRIARVSEKLTQLGYTPAQQAEIRAVLDEFRRG